jgi:hypothetical protein
MPQFKSPAEKFGSNNCIEDLTKAAKMNITVLQEKTT